MQTGGLWCECHGLYMHNQKSLNRFNNNMLRLPLLLRKDSDYSQGEVIQNVKQNFDLMHDCLQSHWKDA